MVFLSLEELKESGLYPKDFDKSLAPRRYKEIIESPPKFFVVYGLRRSGKTYALIKAGEELEKRGYELRYHEASFEEDEFMNNSGRIGKALADEIEAGKKLFIVLDEAFRLPVRILANFVGPILNAFGEFSLALVGSYTYDLFLIEAEIVARHYPKGIKARVFYTTTPRLGRREVIKEDIMKAIPAKPSEVKEYEPEAGPLRLTYREILEKHGLIHKGRVSSDVIEAYMRVLATGGMPRVLQGKAKLEEEIEALAKLVESAYLSDLKRKIDRKIQRPDRESVLNAMNKMLSKGAGRYATIRLSDDATRLALATSLILPRRLIKAESSERFKEELNDLIKRFERLFTAYARPIPSSYMAMRVLEELGVKMPYSGITYESIVAHALLEHYFRFTKSDTLIRKLPIFTHDKLDFIYVSDKRRYAIEVKSSINAEELANIIEETSKLGLTTILALPSDYLDGYVPKYSVSFSKFFGKLERLIEERGMKTFGLMVELISSNILGKVFVECDAKVDKVVCGYSIDYGGASIELSVEVSNAPYEVLETIAKAMEEAKMRLGSSYFLGLPIVIPIELLVAMLSGRLREFSPTA